MSDVQDTGYRLPWPALVLVGAGAGVLVVAGLRAINWLAGPVFLAVVIVILVHPLYARMRRRVSSGLALLGLLIAIYAVVIGLAATMIYAAARLATVLPEYGAEAAALFQALGERLAGLGVGRDQITELVSGFDVNRLAAWLTSLLRAVTGFGASLVFLLSLLLFVGVESTGATAAITRLSGPWPYLAGALLGFATKTRRYLAITAVFAVVVGVADTLLLWWLGVPLAPLWGLLAAVCNFIPYVGFIIGLVPPALLALLGGDWRLMVVIIVFYIVLNSLVTTLIPPYFVGNAVDLPIVITLVSVVFWAWVLGPLGAVLAVPLTLLAKALLVDANPRRTPPPEGTTKTTDP